MTTTTTLAGFIPMALDKSEQANLWSPFAITLLGGLLSSTILALFVIPGNYIIFQDVRRFFQRIFLHQKKPL
jgi:HAE1 family hydrophobic/amphiphilic exporter-1